MPLGFRTEAGPRPDLAAAYGLEEAETSDYAERTERNVLLADGTAVFGHASSSGSRLTIRLCRRHGRPCLHLPADRPAEVAAAELRCWLLEHQIGTLSVAGNRECRAPGIGAKVLAVAVMALRDEKPRHSEE
jgi:hypothetical protein